MGAKASKIDGEYLPETPPLKLKSSTIPHFAHKFDEDKDPRSPNGCRTPIGLYQIASQALEMQESVVQRAQISTKTTATRTTTITNKENAFVFMRKRLLKNFISNDPRSPQTDRTPILFDECIDRTLNLDDTFADLFVDSRAPLTKTVEKTEDQEFADVSLHVHHNNSSLEIRSLPYDEEETMPCPAVLQSTPLKLQLLDPRSPTVGVDRTPIIFGDEDEVHEEQMLENILETLTLNLSNDSSMASFVSASEDGFGDMKETEAKHETETEDQKQPPIDANLNQITNKHLERVRFGIKQRVPPRKPARLRQQQQLLQHQQIYEDINDNLPDNVKTNANLAMNSTTRNTPKSTPKKSFANGINKIGSTTKRTPLSCVKNHAHLRSRSVENSNKARRSQLPLQSFDDQLNPVRCINMPSLHILQSAEDSMDASIF